MCRRVVSFYTVTRVPTVRSRFNFVPRSPSSRRCGSFVGIVRSLTGCTGRHNIVVCFRAKRRAPAALVHTVGSVTANGIFVGYSLTGLLVCKGTGSLSTIGRFNDLVGRFRTGSNECPSPGGPCRLKTRMPVPAKRIGFPTIVTRLGGRKFRKTLAVRYRLGNTERSCIVGAHRCLRKLLSG